MNTEVSIRPLSPQEFPLWDRLVAQCTAATAFHDSLWLVEICAAAGDALELVGAFENAELVAGLPVQVRKRGPFSLARRAFATPYANVLARAEYDGASLIQEFLHRVSLRYSSFTYASSPFTTLPPCLRDWDLQEKRTFVLDLSNTQEIWNGLSKPLRSRIRRAERRGTVIDASPHLEDFYSLYMTTFTRRKLAPPFTRESFCRGIGRVVESGKGKAYVAYAPGGEPCAARLVLFDSTRAYCALAGSNPSVTKEQVSDLLMWEVIRCTSEVRRELDLVGANVKGVAEFNRKYHGELLHYMEASSYRSWIERTVFRARSLVASAKSGNRHE